MPIKEDYGTWVTAYQVATLTEKSPEVDGALKQEARVLIEFLDRVFESGWWAWKS